MPPKPMKPCYHPGCPELTPTGYCDKHKKETRKRHNAYRGSAHSRGYTSRWRRESKRFLQYNAYVCAVCGGIATEVDHIVPHKGDPKLFWNKDNWQPICSPCHKKKTARGE